MRRRLVLTVVAVTTMVAVAFLLPLAAEVRAVARERGLAVADQESQSLAGVLASDPTDSGLTTVVDQLDAGQSRRATVYPADGGRVGPRLPAPSAELALAREGRSFTTATGGSTRVWSAVRLPDGVSVAEVVIPDADLRAGVDRAWVLLGLVGVFVVAAGVALADRLGRSTVRPVQALGEVTRRLRGGDLTARVTPDGPAEVVAVAVAVNELAERITELLALEREAAADLSHGLRTPLTALRLEADSIASGPDRDRIARSVAEVTDAVDSLIRQVRTGRPVEVGTSHDLVASVAGRLELWELLAHEQRRPVTTRLPSHPVVVAATEAQGRAVVDALVGNVVAHTPEGTALRVEVALDPAATVATLIVEDDGPGMDPGLVPQRGRSGAGSTGLGLDIARRAALAGGGDLVVGRARSGGARVEVRFALAAEGIDVGGGTPLTPGADG